MRNPMLNGMIKGLIMTLYFFVVWSMLYSMEMNGAITARDITMLIMYGISGIIAYCMLYPYEAEEFGKNTGGFVITWALVIVSVIVISVFDLIPMYETGIAFVLSTVIYVASCLIAFSIALYKYVKK